MESRDAVVVLIVFLILLITGILIWNSLSDKLYRSPTEVLFSPEELPLEREFCFDGDTGLNYFQKSNVVWGIGDGEFHESNDYCFSIETGSDVWEEGTLFEMHCVGNTFSIKDVKCPGECAEGICV